LWTDFDREGELIASDIANFCLNINSKLVIKRAVFSSITESEIIST
jgi:DNA topoisomerase IA